MFNFKFVSQPFAKLLVMRSLLSNLLYKYVDWERMWYEPKCKFVKGDKVKLNWKAKVYFRGDLVKPLPTDYMIFDRIDNDNVVYLQDGTSWNLYWLCRS